MIGAEIAPTLPELLAVSCPECQEGCESCAGTGELEVCSACKQPADAATNECGCTARCEICEQPGQLDSWAVCQGCRDEMAETMRREAEEHAAFVAEQLELGKQWGWL